MLYKVCRGSHETLIDSLESLEILCLELTKCNLYPCIEIYSNENVRLARYDVYTMTIFSNDYDYKDDEFRVFFKFCPKQYEAPYEIVCKFGLPHEFLGYLVVGAVQIDDKFDDFIENVARNTDVCCMYFGSVDPEMIREFFERLNRLGVHQKMKLAFMNGRMDLISPFLHGKRCVVNDYEILMCLWSERVLMS